MRKKKSPSVFGDQPPRKSGKSKLTCFALPVSPPPDLQKLPKPTREQMAALRLADKLEQDNRTQDELDARARNVQDAYRYLESLASQGSKEAAEYLLLLAWKSIRSLEAVLSEHPDVIKKLAARQMLWPCLVSDKPNLTALNTAHIEQLGLGRRIGIDIKAHWDINNSYSRHAHELLMRLDSLRLYEVHIHSLRAVRSKEAAALINALLHKLGADKELLGKLPQAPLSKVTLKDYAPLLRQMFLARYPHPEKLKDFKNVADNSNRTSDAAKKAKILDLIKQAVMSMLLP